MRQQWETRNSDDSVREAMQTLEFVYDDGSQPFAMIYNDGSTSTLYYYVLNAQGDVIALLNANGTLAASYNYGAWGNYSVHGADGKKRPRILPSSGISIPCVTVVTITTAKRAFTTSRAGTMTSPTTGSSTRMDNLLMVSLVQTCLHIARTTQSVILIQQACWRQRPQLH